MDYRQRAAEIARAYGIPEDLFIRQIEVESGFNPRAVSPAGAGGIAQIMPATARQPGFGITPISDQDRFDPEASLRFGAQYMRAMLDRYDGDQARALAAYNAGFGLVDQAGGVPAIPETQNYVNQILGGQGGQTVFASSRGMGEDRPQGLLGALGIQRRDPSAEGETALPFYQRPTFQDTMGRLALAFNELRDNPSDTLGATIQANAARREDRATTNRTVQELRRRGRDDLADAVETGAITAREAMSMLFQKPDRTAAMQNYEFLISQGVSPQEAIRRAFGENVTRNVSVGAPPAGYMWQYDDAGNPTGLVAAPGGPAAAELEAEANRVATAGEQQATREAAVTGAIDIALDLLDSGGIFDLPEAGIIGGALGNLGVNQEAVDLRNQLDVIGSTVALDRLQQMREASRTGGALGSVTENELKLLMSSLGSINQTSSPELLRESLMNIRTIMNKIENDPIAGVAYNTGQIPAGTAAAAAAPAASDGYSVTGSVGN